MQSNRIVQLTGVLAVLLGIAYLAGVFDSEPSTISVPEIDLATEDITGLRLQTNSWEAVLERNSGRWQVTEPVSSIADSNTVNRLLDSVADLELNSVVSTNRDRHERYGVDQESGRYLTLTGGGEETVLVVAEEGPDFSSSYVRIGEGEQVFAASRIALPISLDQFRDKTLLSADLSSVRAAKVRTQEYEYDLEYGTGWTLSENGTASAADSSKVVSWLRRYTPLRFDGFEDELTPDSVVVTNTVEIVLANGETRAVYMGSRGDDIVAFTNQSPIVMRAAGTRLGFLLEEPDDLRVP